MQRVFSVFMALCVAMSFSFDVHAAKRFGGGKSLGSAPSHQTRQVQQQRSTQQTQAQRPQQQPSGASRWLGPLAGIAAGGLLASLFMGDGFEGFQFLDILILAALAFFIFRFIAKRKRQQLAGHPGMQRQAAPQPTFGGTGGSGRAPIQAPAWFNEQRFLQQARQHFMSLQQCWDRNDMAKIAEFVTPQMMQSLQQERMAQGDQPQTTQVKDLQVQLDGLDDLTDRTVATLTFSGITRSSPSEPGERFSESWRMERAQGANQPWLIAGIRQNA